MPKGDITRVGEAPMAFRVAATLQGQAGKVEDAWSHERIAVTGSNDLWVAALGVTLLNDGRQVVLCPESVAPADEPPLGASKLLHTEGAVLNGPPSKGAEWDLVCYTSGSTGSPRPIGLRTEQLDRTVEWYRDAYDLTADSVIVSPLPSTYNFSFIAGAYTAAVTGATYYVADGAGEVLSLLADPPPDCDRVVGLMNPVVLEAMANARPDIDPRVLLDSGGAPLSRHAVQLYRDWFGDLREGYGLTETCSLTHFDREGTKASQGTVGREMPGVETRVTMCDGKPIISVDAPNAGVELDAHGRPKSPWQSSIDTGDLGTIDDDGRLQILGRELDVQIGGYWPRDTLDVLGPILGARCAIVRHRSGGWVVVRLWSKLSEADTRAIRERVASKLGIDRQSVIVETVQGELLHSQKIPYSVDGNGS
ncbi:AMP-binding protein [Natrinema sp. CGMCC1.2065]|uniref:AMP-binding protein n=1 Tax=Natrinema sp. CGMCC1.2065 TaxID=3445767 RepID=UPI003F4A1DD5